MSQTTVNRFASITALLALGGLLVALLAGPLVGGGEAEESLGAASVESDTMLPLAIEKTAGPVHDPASATEAPAPGEGEPWELVLLGPGDAPLVGVGVWEDKGMAESTRRTTTDARGTAQIDWNASKATSVFLGLPIPSGPRALEQRRTVLRFPELLPISARVIDGETGQPLWVSGMRIKDRGRTIRLVRANAGFSLDVSALRPGTTGSVLVDADLPDRYLFAERDGFLAKGDITRFTRRVQVDAVAWPAANLVVDVVDADDRPVTGARLRTTRMGRNSRGWSHSPSRPGTTDADGRLRVFTVPAVAGEHVVVSAMTNDRHISSKPVRILRSTEVMKVRLVLPREANGNIRLSGSAGSGFGCGSPRTVPIPEGTASLRVSVKRLGGRPAVGAEVNVEGDGGMLKGHQQWWVRSQRCNDQGEVLFERLPPEDVRVTVTEIGYLDSGPETVALTADAETTHIMTEQAGLPLTVRVVDDLGAPVPSAAITGITSAHSLVHLDDHDTQPLVLFTGADGRCRIPRVAPGKVHLYANFGSRRGQGSGRPGTTITIQLPAATSKAR